MLYVCTKCGAPAKKPPLVAIVGWKSAPLKDFIGLGQWRCTAKCGKVPVKRLAAGAGN